jgi:hypothetical protein
MYFCCSEPSPLVSQRSTSPLNESQKVNFKHTPLIWDTGATHELTPFLKDFIHYHLCDIPVKDFYMVNRVIEVGTVMHKFHATNGEDAEHSLTHWL